MKLLYDSRNSCFKKPFGAVKAETKVRINVWCNGYVQDVFLILYKDGESEKRIKMNMTGRQNEYGIYTSELAFESYGLYFYRFCVKTENGEKIYGRDEFGEADENADAAWQLLCYDKNFSVPDDFLGATYYQIFPDRYNKSGECDLKDKLGPFVVHKDMSDIPIFSPNESGEITNNDFFGGNLKGICEKLDELYLFGIRVIYLNPIFMAYSNHRYDTADYMRIDPMLGTEKDFKNLCNEAHKRGMKIILDGVFSHTGDNSIYFDKYNHFGTGAATNPSSPYLGWYKFYEYPNVYESWWGIGTLPCVEEMAPGFIDFIITGPDSVVKHWLRAGADGFRLDVADELPDEFIRLLYQTVKEEKPDAVVIGEVWEDASNKISYGIRRKYFQAKELDGVMNYVYRKLIIDFVLGKISGEYFTEYVMRLAENYPKEALLSSMVFLSTHDTGRILTLLAGIDGNAMTREERAVKRLDDEQYKKGIKILGAAVFLLFTLPGSPCIYYGDEIGMQGYEDPFNRAFYTAWQKDEKVYEIYKTLAKIREEELALRWGDVFPFLVSDGVVTFIRCIKDEKLLCAVNMSDKTLMLPNIIKEVVFCKECVEEDKKITLLPYGRGIFKID